MLSKRGIVAIIIIVIAAIGAYLLLGGAGQKKQAMSRSAQVKVMKIVKQDMPLTLEYAGQIKGMDEVKVKSRVSGSVVEKFIQGGQHVVAGQPLYRIDDRQYNATLWSAKANLAQAQANLSNARLDLARDEQLFAAAAISEQKVSTQRSQVAALMSNVAAMEALVQQAQQSVDDTVVYAPISGKLAVDDVAVGTYAAAGNTELVSIGSGDPVYVQFSISESEYLKYVSATVVPGQALSAKTVHIQLSDGSEYPIAGTVTEVDRSLADNAGSLIVKAQFANPEGILIPGMFARAKLVGDTQKDAILVPQRAVQQLLGKSFVMLVGEDGKSVAKTVELGTKVGSYYIVDSGLNGDEQVIVEGLTTLTEGMDLTATDVTPEEMGFSFTESNL